MKTIKPMMVMIVIATLSTACTTKSATPTTHDRFPAKSPQTVSLYTSDKTPPSAYRVIGLAKVSRYNLIGSERKEDTVNTLMKQAAASIGGDGIIDINQTNKDVEGKIIAYQKILI